MTGDAWGGGGTQGNSTDPGASQADASTTTGSGDGSTSSTNSIDGGAGAVGSVDGSTTTGPGGTVCGVVPSTFCDVQAITQTYHCVTCHAAMPVAGAPMSLITYANFLAPAKSDATKTVAQLVLARTAAQTMPPAGFAPVSAADEAKIQSWVANGTSSSCTTPTQPASCNADAGTGTGGGTGTPGSADSGAGATRDAGTGTGTGTGTGGTTGGNTADAGAGTQASFCAVEDVIQRNTCLNCHTAPPINGAPMSLLTYADLTMPAVSNRAMTVGQLVLARTTARTMPPGGVPALSSTDLQTISTWLNAGSPNVCPTPPTGGTGTTGADAGGGSTTTTADAGTTARDAGGGSTISPVIGTSANDPWCSLIRDVAPTCAQCHASPPRNSAPMSLLTYADWTRPAVTQPSLIVGSLALTRMSNGTMPPGGGATATMIADVQNWVNGGMANSTCGQAGTGDAGAGVVDPFSTPVVCTSKQTMTTPDGPTMRPGEACLSCHTGSGGGGDDSSGGGDDNEAALYTLAGTVYPTAHEPNDCVGAINGGGSVVTVMDAAGRSIPLTPNAVGNFFYAGAVTFPITARITKNGLSRSMTTPQTNGNCNSCHTVTGVNGAPGRILEPF